MRCLIWILLLLGSTSLADKNRGKPLVPAAERCWIGEIVIRASSREPVDGRGREEQTERLSFVLVTRAPQAPTPLPTVPFALREATGSYAVRFDVRDGGGATAVTTQGGGTGRLHPRIGGEIEKATGRIGLLIHVTPAALRARKTLSGVDGGQFRVFHTIVTRQPLCGGLKLKGELTDNGRRFQGERRYVDRKAERVRDVHLTWSLVRVDPVLRGRVVDQHGRPVSGARIRALGRTPRRFREKKPPLVREATTAADGHYEIEADWGHWSVQSLGFVAGAELISPARHAQGVQLAATKVPVADLMTRRYARARLPWPRKLETNFARDAGAYLGWLEQRLRPDELAAALVK